jgi:hypothetical protein
VLLANAAVGMFEDDYIGQNFAFWTIGYSESFFENVKSSPKI